VEHSITAVLADESGRWLLSSAHPGARSEFALNYINDSGASATLIIDRTFIAEKTTKRWLIDYKSSKPVEGETLQTFLEREEEAYTRQLSVYKNALAGLGDEAIQCALYFTALGHLHLVNKLSDG